MDPVEGIGYPASLQGVQDGWAKIGGQQYIVDVVGFQPITDERQAGFAAVQEEHLAGVDHGGVDAVCVICIEFPAHELNGFSRAVIFTMPSTAGMHILYSSPISNTVDESCIRYKIEIVMG